jgi:hypothetical protein
MSPSATRNTLRAQTARPISGASTAVRRRKSAARPAAAVLAAARQADGETHLLGDERAAQLKAAGYDDPAQFVAHVAQDYGEIWSGERNRLLLVRRVAAGEDGKAHTLVVGLQPAADGSAREVVTAGDFRGDYPGGGGRELLWQRGRAHPAPDDSGGQGPIGGAPGGRAGTGIASAGGQSIAQTMGREGGGVK